MATTAPGAVPGLKLVATHHLADDPPRTHRINANSFQQDAIVSYKGWQYVCFYSEKHGAASSSPSSPPRPGSDVLRLSVNIARRSLEAGSAGSWEVVTFRDYDQVADDGHNTISMGICEQDGTIHVSFDHHCDDLHFRMSQPGLADDPARFEWTSSVFGPIRNRLPGSTLTNISLVTYPRFLSTPDSFFFCYRIGRAGGGSDVLFKYSGTTGNYDYLGQFLTGVNNSPYINGISYTHDTIHVSGCFRGFVEYEGAHDTSSTTHTEQAGPNGPENNYDFFYTYSSDGGQSWRNSNGQEVASLSKGETVLPDSRGIVVFDIPRNSGILNQEAQTCDDACGFHALNRENNKWIHYYRTPKGAWSKHTLPACQPTSTGSRGSLLAIGNTLYIALPGNSDDSLSIMACSISGDSIGEYRCIWREHDFDGEPHLSTFKRRDQTYVSVFTRTSASPRRVVVLDLVIEEETK